MGGAGGQGAQDPIFSALNETVLVHTTTVVVLKTIENLFSGKEGPMGVI